MNIRNKISLLITLAMCISCAPDDSAMNAAADTDASSDRPLTIKLTPNVKSGRVQDVEVEILIPSPNAEAGEAFLSMAIVMAMMPGALLDPAELRARDDAGALELTIEDDPVDPSNFRQFRQWAPVRATEGDVIVAYAATPRVITSETRPGPLLDMRTEGAGFYGSGVTMLALPVNGWPRPVMLNWNLAQMETGARGASSLGEGDVKAHLDRDALASSFFMAGPLHSQPRDGSGEFVVYWLTDPVFDLNAAAHWTEKAYRYAYDFFDRTGGEFRIFMRTTARFQGGGTGGHNSFIFGNVAGEDRDPHELRALLAHETFHSFVGGLGGGSTGAGAQWYSEGANSYYTIILPHRAELTTVDDVADAFNAHALNYYTNPKSNLSNDDVTRLFFSDNNAQLVPYNRGPLYFAMVDARMREISGGERRVDELVLQFIDGRDRAEDPVAYWRSLVAGALGDKGGNEFDGMMAGAPLDLPSGLLGPCFRSEEKTLRKFQLGFRPYKDDDGATRAGTVIPGSAADLAGVKAHDEIVNADVLENAEKSEPQKLTLDIRKSGEMQSLTYAPWTAPAPGKQWVRTEIPDSQCDI